MNVLVCEWVTGGGLCGEPLPGIVADALMIRDAQIADLSQAHGVTVRALCDARLPVRGADTAVEIERVSSLEEFAQCWRSGLEWAEAVWLTAPETADVLPVLSQQVLDAGCLLLGSAPDAARIAGSKRATFDTLSRAGIACIPTFSQARDAGSGPVVVKPDDGAGCVDTREFADADSAARWGEAMLGARAVYQPRVHGDDLSLTLLCALGHARLLLVNEQMLDRQRGVFTFRGTIVRAADETCGAHVELADRIAAAIPGLWGFVGIDLIDTPEGAVVVEINPRCTLPYAAMRSVLGRNPAQALLQLPYLPPGVRRGRVSREIILEVAHDAVAA